VTGEGIGSPFLLDFMGVTCIHGKHRMLTGSACGALLFGFVLRLIEDEIRDREHADNVSSAGSNLGPYDLNDFLRLPFNYAKGMTLMNDDELDFALEDLTSQGIITVIWPEDSAEDGSFTFCHIRVNKKRLDELSAERFRDRA